LNEPTWASRNIFLQTFNLENKSVVDFGCGDKSILNYCKFKEYLGIDKNSNADIVTDLNNYDFTLPKKYDVGIILGVLEYLDNPEKFLKFVSPFAKTFIILILPRQTPKKEWKQSFSTYSFESLLNNIFKKINYYNNGKYLIAKCM